MIVELIELSRPNDSKLLGKVIKSRSYPGEYTIHPVDARAFERWSKTASDQKLNVQYTERSLTWQVMLKLHDVAAGVVVDHLIMSARRNMPTMQDALEMKLRNHTGLFALKCPGKSSKNADAAVFTQVSGKEYHWPGIVLEVGYSETRQELRRDASLWVEYSDYNVKLAMAIKVGIGENGCFRTIIFELWGIDWNKRTRSRPIGRAKKQIVIDCSSGKIPSANWVQEFPSYFFFPDGIYPPAYPPHPSPPPQEQPVTLDDFESNKQPSSEELNFYNREIALRNDQRKPIVVNFANIRDDILALDISP